MGRVEAGKFAVESESGLRLRAGPGQWLFVPTEKIHQRFSNDARASSPCTFYVSGHSEKTFFPARRG